jgi:hypothetical protein
MLLQPPDGFPHTKITQQAMMTPTHNYSQTTTSQHLQPLAFQYPTTFDTDEQREPPSLSSSPISQYSTTYTTYHSVPESHSSIPRSIGGIGGIRNTGENTQQMNSDDWNSTSPFRSKLPRGNHNRDSSLSSLGSLGPTSPYPHSGITPRIAIADAGTEEAGADAFHGLADYPHEALWSENNYAIDSKTPLIADAWEAQGAQGHHSIPFGAPAVAQRQRVELSVAAVPNIRHGAESVASSGRDSPSTPAMGEPIEKGRRMGGEREYLNRLDPHITQMLECSSPSLPAFPHVPKLERSITDACQDTIYSGNMSVGSAAPPNHDFSLSNRFSSVLEAANTKHLNAGQPGAGYRGSSPFRNGSPLAPTHGHEYPRATHFHMVPPAMHAMHDASPTTAGPSGTPQTISPKDAMLEADHLDDGQYSLFHALPTPSYGGQDHFMRDVHAPAGVTHLPYGTNPGQAVRVPQHYPFMPGPIHANHASHAGGAVGTERILEQPQMALRQEQAVAPAPAPGTAVDDGGTYSCTYHGCTLRFNTQKDLQTHKREGHRGGGAARRGDRRESQQTQNGPHTCTRINPSTGKPCMVHFSRPYDLTRHEDTIHNISKKKLRCPVCTEEKLFSRRDALNRHYKVCHEELYESEFLPKRRRANRS